MALQLNQPVAFRALGAAHSGHIDHGDSTPPERNADNSIGHDPDAIESEKHKHVVIGHDGKVIAKGVAAAHAEAGKNGDGAILPALKKIADAIAMHGGAKNMSRDNPDLAAMAFEAVGKLADRLCLSTAMPLATCKDCGSHDVERADGMDTCKHCGASNTAHEGTVTAYQYTNREQVDDSKAPEYVAQQTSAPGSDFSQGGIAAYDPEFEQTEYMINTPALPDGSPNLRSGFARRLFGVGARQTD